MSETLSVEVRNGLISGYMVMGRRKEANKPLHFILFRFRTPKRRTMVGSPGSRVGECSKENCRHSHIVQINNPSNEALYHIDVMLRPSSPSTHLYG